MAELARTFTKQTIKTVSLDYLIYLPENYVQDSEAAWPLIVFLHGKGERGNDLAMIKKHGIAQITIHQRTLPFVLLAPQCPLGTWWGEQTDALDALVDDVAQQFHVDTTRVYLTGLSMGGYGTWHFATLFPHRFAAVAPICGGGSHWHDYPGRVTALKDTPVWAFHGADDPVVPVSESQILVDVLQDAGGDARLTIYPNTLHDSWTKTYSNPELYTWFFAHQLVSKLPLTR